MLKYISAVFILLALVSPAIAYDSTVIPGRWYVDGARGNNDPDTPWGWSEQYPCATITYLMSRASMADNWGGSSSTHDTVYVTNSDSIDLGGDSPSLEVGIDFRSDPLSLQTNGYVDVVGIDSPIYGYNTAEVVFYFGTGDAVNYPTNNVISGIIFRSAPVCVNNASVDGMVVRDVTFDSCGDATRYPLYASNRQATSMTMYVNNSSFANNVTDGISGSIRIYPQGLDGDNYIYVDNCSFRGDSIALSSTSDSTAFFVTNSIINADKIAYTNATGAVNFYFTNCDTYGSGGLITVGGGVGPQVIQTSVIDVDPLWVDARYSTDQWKAYYTDATVGTASTTGGPLGVYGSFQAAAAPAASVTRRNSFFFSRWARLLGIGL